MRMRHRRPWHAKEYCFIYGSVRSVFFNVVQGILRTITSHFQVVNLDTRNVKFQRPESLFVFSW